MAWVWYSVVLVGYCGLWRWWGMVGIGCGVGGVLWVLVVALVGCCGVRGVLWVIALWKKYGYGIGGALIVGIVDSDCGVGGYCGYWVLHYGQCTKSICYIVLR